MRVLGVVVVLAALAPLRAQGATVEDLFAHDWQARNRAAAALCAAATVDEKALVEAMGRKIERESDKWNAAVGLGDLPAVEDPVRDLLEHHRRRIPRRYVPRRARTPLTPSDLVVPFEPRLLAAFVLHARGARSEVVVAKWLELAADSDSYWGGSGLSAAEYAWRVGSDGAALRSKAMGEPLAAERLASCASVAGDAAGAELLAALRSGVPLVQAKVLEHLDVGRVVANEEFAQFVFQHMGGENGRVADDAAALVREAELFERAEFVDALSDPRRVERATRILLDLPSCPQSLASALTALLADTAMPGEARERAAFVLRDLGSRLERDQPELARAAYEALTKLYVEPKLPGRLGLAAIAALGGFAKSMSPECEQRLAEHANAWTSNIQGGQFAALGALLESRRVDAMPLDVLAAHWKAHRRDGLADRIAGALFRRGSAAEVVLRADPRYLVRRQVESTSDLVPFAPTLRAWLDDEDTNLRGVAARMLLRLGADSGVDEAALLRSCRDGRVAPSAPLFADGERAARCRLLAAVASTESSFEWIAANWGDSLPSPRTLARIAAAPFPFERRSAWLRPLLAHARAEDWPVQHLEPETLRRIAHTVHADSQGGSAALTVLAKSGPLGPEDEALFRAALEGDGAAGALVALTEAKMLPSSLRKAVEALCDDVGERSIARAACDLLWATRPR